MVVRMRHTRGHTANRRSHHGLSDVRLSKCPSCGALTLRHRVCATCGKYRGRVVVDVAARAEKEQKKRKAREAEAKRAGA